MNVVDSSGWLEYLAEGPNADFFAPALVEVGALIVPTSAIKAAVAANNARYPNEQRMSPIESNGCGCQVGGAGVGKLWLATLLGAFLVRVTRRWRRR